MQFINNISIELKGKLFDKRTILKVIDNIHCKELNIVNDLKNWIDTLQI